MPPALEILYEDNHCIAINKPAGVASAHFQGDESTADHLVKAYLKEKYRKAGNVFLGVVHRLDKPVSGVLLFARTSKAAARLSAQFREGSVEKVYWAVVEGRFAAPALTVEDWLLKNEEQGRVNIVPAGTKGAKQAVMHVIRRGQHAETSWLELRPQTGRTHQIRVQLAHLRLPVFGDAKYGSVHTFENGIALLARSLTFFHPTKNEPITLTAEPAKIWTKRFAHLLHPVKP